MNASSDNRAYRQTGIAPIAIILIIAGVLALAGGGWYYKTAMTPIKYWFRNPVNFQECKEASRGIVILALPAQCEWRNTKFIDNQSLGSTDKTANWKTYRNEQYEFEIKYPPQWVLKIRSDKFIDIETDGPRLLSIQILPDRILPSSDLINTVTFHKNNNTVFISDAFFTADSPTRKFQQIDDNTFNQILSTFKFTK